MATDLAYLKAELDRNNDFRAEWIRLNDTEKEALKEAARSERMHLQERAIAA